MFKYFTNAFTADNQHISYNNKTNLLTIKFSNIFYFCSKYFIMREFVKSIFLLIIVLSFTNKTVKSQDSLWQNKTHGISFSASTLIIATPLNFSYNYMIHKEKFHYGLTTGLTVGFYEITRYSSLGAHAVFTMFFGKKEGHFESKFGFSYSPIILYSKTQWTDYAYEFVPIISLGYRYQEPGSDNFWRVFVSTGGFGIGVGKILNN